MPDLFGGTITNLATEIAEGLDTDDLDLENPGKLFKGLLSGNLGEDDNDGGIFNLVKNITGKIHDKLSSGELDETSLFNEASSVINNLNKVSKNASNPFVNLFSNVLIYT